MEYKLLDIAYGALLHDIGKFYQRTMPVSDLSDTELMVTPFNKKGGYYTHLHSGYTSRFLNQYLGMYNELERMVSEHHIYTNEHVHEIIQQADRIASAIDRQDEESDSESINRRGSFIKARLHSVLGEVDFGKEKEYVVFPLSTLDDMDEPVRHFSEKNVSESAKEYKELFEAFIAEIEDDDILGKHVTLDAYNRMYNLLNKYLVTVPASTYENSRPTVSLFDHLKLTSAIASCLYNETCFNEKKFYMLELDISGIQSFIYQVTEGSENKRGLARALRGRSILVGIITNAIAYAFIDAFGLTQSNILFNTGGGALILLPYDDHVQDQVEALSKALRKELFSRFQTDITFVSALIALNAEELEAFQAEKAVDLKESLGRNKMRKFYDLIDHDFFYEKIDENNACRLCGRTTKHEFCAICKAVEDISYIYTHYDSFGIVYDYRGNFKGEPLRYQDRKRRAIIDLSFVQIYFIDQLDVAIMKHVYVDSINDFGIGSQKMVANSVPLDYQYDVLAFEKIISLTPSQYGDKKLAILKMDVDNLGGIFAFGLKKSDEPKKQRSISKYVTMSRLFEYFFGHELVNICQDVSRQINPDIDDSVSNQTMFYINYAGGDDLVIIGSAYSIIQLTLEIYKRFSNFTGNKNITISGGIHIQNEKRPIRFGIQEAEEALELSKSEEKNAITLIDTRVPFTQFEALLKDVNQITEMINSGAVSRTMLYNIMSNIADKSYTDFVYLVPRIQYVLYRNVGKTKNKDAYNWLLTLINSVEDNDQSVRYLELKLKLTMLFTREGNN